MTRPLNPPPRMCYSTKSSRPSTTSHESSSYMSCQCATCCVQGADCEDRLIKSLHVAQVVDHSTLPTATNNRQGPCQTWVCRHPLVLAFYYISHPFKGYKVHQGQYGVQSACNLVWRMPHAEACHNSLRTEALLPMSMHSIHNFTLSVGDAQS